MPLCCLFWNCIADSLRGGSGESFIATPIRLFFGCSRLTARNPAARNGDTCRSASLDWPKELVTCDAERVPSCFLKAYACSDLIRRVRRGISLHWRSNEQGTVPRCGMDDVEKDNTLTSLLPRTASPIAPVPADLAATHAGIRWRAFPRSPSLQRAARITPA